MVLETYGIRTYGIENSNINNVNEVFYAYLIQHNKQYDYYLIKYHFKIVLTRIIIKIDSSLTYLIIKQ